MLSDSPTITLSPDSKGVDENDRVTVRCEAKGYPPPKLKWLKLLGNRVVGEGNFFSIESVQRSDQGRYRCIATNGFGDDATAEFKINVYCELYQLLINVVISQYLTQPSYNHKVQLPINHINNKSQG